MQALNIFVWTFLLVLLTGLFVLGMEWTVASLIHAPSWLTYTIEGFSVIGLIYLFWVIFKQAYASEKSGFDQGL